MKKHICRCSLVLLLAILFQNLPLHAQFNGGAIALNEGSLVNRSWHLTNKRGSDFLLRAAGNGLRADNNNISAASSFVVEGGEADASWTTPDERWFYIRNKSNGLYITVDGGGDFPRAVTFADFDPANHGQQFRLIVQGQADQYKLRCRLSQDGPDMVLEVNSNGDLQADAPKLDPSSEQKFSFNLAMIPNGTVIIPINTKRGRFLSDNGIKQNDTPVVQNSQSDEASGWIFETLGNDYYHIINKLTGQYLTAANAADVTCRTSSGGDRSEWKLDRNNATFHLINRKFNAPLSVGIFYAQPGSSILMGTMADFEQIKWILTEAPEEPEPTPAGYQRIETGSVGNRCLFIIGPQFKRSICERAGLESDDQYLERHFNFIVEAIEAKYGPGSSTDMFLKFEMNNPGHRADLAFMVRRYLTETLPAIPRNQWSVATQAVVGRIEYRVGLIRTNYANTLTTAWDSYKSEQGGNISLADLYFYWLDADGFDWPDYHPYTINQAELFQEYARAGADFDERNAQIAASSSIGLTVAGAIAYFNSSLNVLGVIRQLGFFLKGLPLYDGGTLLAPFPTSGFLSLAGPVAGVISTAASFLVAQVQDNLELQEFEDRLYAQVDWAQQPINIPAVMNGNDMIAAIRLLTDLDYIFGMPVIVNSVDDNVYVQPFGISCVNAATVHLGANGQATLDQFQVLNGLPVQVCGTDIDFTLSQNQFSCSDIGTPVSVTLTATNDRHSESCQVSVSVVDEMPPTVTCTSTTLYLNAAGTASLNPADAFGGVSDNCGVAFTNGILTLYDCGDIGVNTVPVIVYDEHQNQASCNAIVTVVDNIAPTATCQSTTLQLNASGEANLALAEVFLSGTDNCGIINPQSVSKSLFNCSNLGAQTVTLVVNDGHSNTATCQATVVVEDNLAPNVVCQNKTVFLNAAGQADITTADVYQSGSDNCGAVNQQDVTPSAFTCNQLGNNAVTLTVNDGHGNTSTCTATVTVKDAIVPTMQCKNATIFLNAAGQAALSPMQVNNGSVDNCGISILSVFPNSFGCANLGNNQVELTGADASNNRNSCFATVTVVDAIAPVAKCKPATLNLAANGQATLLPASINNLSTDNCTVNLEVLPGSFNCGNVGVNAVTLKVTDAAGNAATCQTTVTVKDITAPTAACKNTNIYLDGLGKATLAAAQVNNNSSDACGIASMSLSMQQFNCSDLGSSKNVTLTVKDVNQNTSTCLASVTVKDSIRPDAFCQDVTVVLSQSGKVTVYGETLAEDSYDNCAITTYSPAAKMYTTANIGVNYLTIQVKDFSNNTSSCVSQVKVLPFGSLQQGDNRGENARTTGASLVLSPNPASSRVNLRFVLEQEGIFEVSLFNLSGSRVWDQEQTGLQGENILDLPLNDIAPGVYFLELRAGVLREQRKLVVVKG